MATASVAEPFENCLPCNLLPGTNFDLHNWQELVRKGVNKGGDLGTPNAAALSRLAGTYQYANHLQPSAGKNRPVAVADGKTNKANWLQSPGG